MITMLHTNNHHRHDHDHHDHESSRTASPSSSSFSKTSQLGRRTGDAHRHIVDDEDNRDSRSTPTRSPLKQKNKRWAVLRRPNTPRLSRKYNKKANPPVVRSFSSPTTQISSNEETSTSFQAKPSVEIMRGGDAASTTDGELEDATISETTSSSHPTWDEQENFDPAVAAGPPPPPPPLTVSKKSSGTRNESSPLSPSGNFSSPRKSLRHKLRRSLSKRPSIPFPKRTSRTQSDGTASTEPSSVHPFGSDTDGHGDNDDDDTLSTGATCNATRRSFLQKKRAKNIARRSSLVLDTSSHEASPQRRKLSRAYSFGTMASALASPTTPKKKKSVSFSMTRRQSAMHYPHDHHSNSSHSTESKTSLLDDHRNGAESSRKHRPTKAQRDYYRDHAVITPRLLNGDGRRPSSVDFIPLEDRQYGPNFCVTHHQNALRRAFFDVISSLSPTSATGIFHLVVLALLPPPTWFPIFCLALAFRTSIYVIGYHSAARHVVVPNDGLGYYGMVYMLYTHLLKAYIQRAAPSSRPVVHHHHHHHHRRRYPKLKKRKSY